MFAGAKSNDQVIIQGRAFVIDQQVADDIQKTGGSLLVKGYDDIAVVHFVGPRFCGG